MKLFPERKPKPLWVGWEKNPRIEVHASKVIYYNIYVYLDDELIGGNTMTHTTVFGMKRGVRRILRDYEHGITYS